MTERRGYVATVVGAWAGALLIGGSAAFFITRMPCTDDDFSCLGVALLAVFAAVVGAMVGAMAGIYLALRLRRHPFAGRTTWLMIPVLACGWGLLWLAANVAHLDGRRLVPMVVLVFLLVPIGARWSAFALVRGSGSKSDGSSDIV